MRQRKYIVFIFICLILIAILINSHWFTIIRVSGSSMEPSLEAGSVVIVHKNTEYQRGDIVLIQMSNRTYIVKRIVGIGGDNILLTSDCLFVNHSLIDNTPNHQNTDYQFEVNVPDGTIFILGDNRMESTDSRDLGCIDVDSVIGIVQNH